MLDGGFCKNVRYSIEVAEYRHVACVSTEHPEVIDMPVGRLDDPERFPPTCEILSDTKLSWVSGHHTEDGNVR